LSVAGGIILFHDIHASTALALPELLSLLKAKGFRVVHLQPKSAVEIVAGFEGAPAREANPSAVHHHRRSVTRAKAGHGGSQWLIW
jgi:peptidoglycan-N-acetylglucosamine deacetylase